MYQFAEPRKKNKHILHNELHPVENVKRYVDGKNHPLGLEKKSTSEKGITNYTTWPSCPCGFPMLEAKAASKKVTNVLQFRGF